jgi:hypothetical protein
MEIDYNTTSGFARDKVWYHVRDRELDKIFHHELNSLRPYVWEKLFVPVSSYSNALRSLTREQVRYEMYAVKNQ